MIHAYQEIYLSNAQSALGDAFDTAVNTCGIAGEDFVKLFAASSVSKQMENGDPAVIAGLSGMDIAKRVLFETTGKEYDVMPRSQIGRSKEYWVGWAVAYYQWLSSKKYSEIFQAVSFEELITLYPTLHEADITKFAAVIDTRMKEVFPGTSLKRIRTAFGCTQEELADYSGVTLRSIQMYEQRKKDINKASAQTLYKISKVLGCTIEDLLEK